MTESPKINEALKAYSAEVEWDGKDAIRLIHLWWERMSTAFALGEMATPAILMGKPRGQASGRYYCQRNGFGLLHQLLLSKKRLLNQPPALFLAGLVRELLQEWQHLHAGACSARYYTTAVRAKAAALGLRLDRRGRLLGVAPGPFTQLLEQHGVDTSIFAGPLPAEPPSDRQRFTKWGCACVIFLATPEVQINGLCKTCGQDYRRLARPAKRSNRPA